MNDKILLQVLENQKETAEKMGRITEIVERHDSVTFPKMENILTRMESKQNDHIIKCIADKEEFDKKVKADKEELERRIKPLEDDYKHRKEVRQEIKKNVTAIAWDWIKKSVPVIGALIVAKLTGWFK